MNDAEIYEARLEIVDFLVEVFYDAPEEAFVDRLLSGDLQVPDGEVNDHMDRGFRRLERFVEANRDRDPETVATELGREYTRLFVGPRPPVLPHETYYREDTALIGEGLAEVEASYSAAGWAPPEDYPEENDFIAVELAFLRNLIDRQRTGHEETFGFERVFLDEHLLRWYEPFLADLDDELDPDEAEGDLFLAAGEVFAGFVEFEDELVAQQVPS
jgi:TorA maturation chaperone TorD